MLCSTVECNPLHILQFCSSETVRGPTYWSPVARTTRASRAEVADAFSHRFRGVNGDLWACILSLRSLRKLSSLRHLSRSQWLVTLPQGFNCETRNIKTQLRGRLQHVMGITCCSLLFADLPVTFFLSPSAGTA